MAGATVMAAYSYGYDDTGNITSIQDSIDATRNRTFGYDDLNRLTSANTGSSLWGTGSYTYDEMGNLKTSVRGSATTNFGYAGTTPKLTSVTEPGGTVAVTYDAAGNEVASGSTYTISPRNYIARSTTTPTYLDYVYDGAGVRTRTHNTPRLLADASWKQYSFYNPGKNLLSRLDFTTSSGTTTLTKRTEFVWFGGRPIAQFTNGDLSTRRFTATDHLGTPIIQTDTTGTIVWRAEYDPYGTIYQMRTGTEAEQILRLPGQEMATDRESYNIFRWYRSGWGRYTQADPTGLAAGLNLYAYALENPNSLVDTLGAQPNFPQFPPSRTEDCGPQEWKYWEGKCGSKRVVGCYVTIRHKLQTVVGFPRFGIQRIVNCNCKEDACEKSWTDKLKDLLKEFTDPNRPPSLPFIPIWPKLPAPKPVIPGLPPYFVNPCYLNNYPGCGDPGRA
jgi:RHS repeat-associated protein